MTTGSAEKTRYSELVLFAEADVPSLCRSMARLGRFLAQTRNAPLRDVAFTCARSYKAVEKKNALKLENPILNNLGLLNRNSSYIFLQ